MKLRAALCALLLASPFAYAGPNLVLNGDFENLDYSMWTLASPGGGGMSFGVDVTGSPLADPNNHIFGDLNTTEFGFLRQSIATIAGATYQLKFDLQRWPSDPQFPPDNRSQVKFGDVVVYDESDVTGDWETLTLIVMASSNLTLLQFGNFNNDPVFWNQLDNVRLEFLRGPNDPGDPEDVPEPATLTLLAGGLAALRLARRRKHS